jgi:Flp pilus assembly protein TadD
LRKRLYGQAAESLKLAAKRAGDEPSEAQALIENALGFSLAAQNNYAAAIKHYRVALKAKADYPVALNNLAFALEKQQKPDEARSTYQQVLELDSANRTAQKRLKRLERTAA